MRPIASALLSMLVALSVLAGVAGQVNAATADEMSPNSSGYLDQLDRENRGGQGQ